MAEVIAETCEIKNKANSEIINPQRRKILVKKLEKIKLRRSSGNIFFSNVRAFYEKKIRTLKNNNLSLANALAEQHQISQSWYDEVIALKEELHETREDLLRYQVSENVDCDIAVQTAAEKCIREIAGPLESAVKDCLDHVLDVVDSMTKVKQLVASLFKISNEKSSSSTPFSETYGPRPLLFRTTKLPRKNVVHPMVEGHVLQPATIHLPRMTLEERRRYRLQERAENVEMGVIGEHSTSLTEEASTDEPTPEVNDPPNVALPTLGSTPEVLPTIPAAVPIQTESQTPDPLPATVPVPEDASPETAEYSKVESRETTAKISVVDVEDPLEGSSWMHLKRKRGSRKRKSRSNGASLRSAALPLPVDSSSDSDEERCQRNFKKSSNSVSKQKEVRYSSPSPVDDCLPMLCLVRMEETGRKIVRRSTRRTRMLQRSKSDERQTYDEPSSVAHAPFFIKESRVKEPGNVQSQVSADISPTVPPIELVPVATSALEIASATAITTVVSSSISSASLIKSPNLDTVVNIKTTAEISSLSKQIEEPIDDKNTVITSTPVSHMKLIKGLIKGAMAEGKKEKKAVPICKNEKEKNFSKGLKKDEVVEVSMPKEKASYDLPIKEMPITDSDALKKGKENVPPKVETATDNANAKEVSINLKTVSIIIEDIMKIPSIAADFSLYSRRSNKGKRKTCSKINGTKKGLSPDKSVSGNRKRRVRKSKDESPARKSIKTKRKVNFSPRQQQWQSSSGLTSPSDNDACSPIAGSRKKVKRRTVPKLKLKVRRKPKSALCEANSHDDISIFECSSDAFDGFEDQSDPENNNSNSSSQMEDLKGRANTTPHLDAFETHIKADKILIEDIDSEDVIPFVPAEAIVAGDPIFNKILEEVTTLLKDSLEYEEFDPLALSSLIKKEPRNEDVCCVPVINSMESCSPFNFSTSGELVKARPRRAAARVTSLKEPSLNTKLCQETGKMKYKRS